jgi:hypothetical protein
MLAYIEEAICGRIKIDSSVLEMKETQSLSYYSESMHRDQWYSNLKLSINGNRSNTPPMPDQSLLDTHLRCADPPFDGMRDLCSWLGFSDNQLSRSGPTIAVQVLPPIDLIFDKCGLSGNRLTLSLLATKSFDTKRFHLAVHAIPVDGLVSRLQVASKISWADQDSGLMIGTAVIEVEKMDSALVMLSVGNATIRRQWILDPTRAQNNRLVAVQLFDKELRMLKQSVLQTADSNRFELGVEALLFLLGFAPTVMIEKDAPDLIVASPSGRLILVECTTRIADFNSKLGKLIDRRGLAVKVMQESGHGNVIHAALVCALPRDQIAISEAELVKHNILLVTADELTKVLHQTRFPTDPDKLLDESLASIAPKRFQD